MVAIYFSGSRSLNASANRLREGTLEAPAEALAAGPGPSAAEIHLRPDACATARSAIAIVQRNAQIQAKLIDDLLDMNRLLSGNLQIELTPIDVGATLETALQGHKHLAELHGGTIRVSSGGPGAGATFNVELPTAGARAQQ
jgi:signal transduction histidine kinase